MARKAYADFNLNGNDRAVQKDMAGALATLASGANPDASAYYMPVVAPPATPTAVAAAGTDVVGIAATANLRLLGYSMKESAGTPAVASVNLRHGVVIGAALLATEELAADGSVTRWFGPNGIACAGGIFVDRTGEAEIVLYTSTAV